MRTDNGFIWGAATAAYQIEGAWNEDGKGPSVWDAFCRIPGKIWRGHSGDVACDHYHRMEEDVALMKELELQSYRFSISWPRVLPEGTGGVNEKGLAFYDRLVDALLEAGIRPAATLFHWDYPLALYDRGGWLNRDSADWFAEYAGVVVNRLADRVSLWMTHNEPQCFIGGGHMEGRLAPGLKLGLRDQLRAVHHTLLAHGAAVEVIRAQGGSKAQVGIVTVGHHAIPAEDTEAHIEAARRVTFSDEPNYTWSNKWWFDPVFFGAYPEALWNAAGAAVPEIRDGDMARIAQPTDFLGLNIYWGERVEPGPDGTPRKVDPPVGNPMTHIDWNVEPASMYWMPRFFHERYQKPMFITESGLSCADWVSLDGKVHDYNRIDFLTRYLRELQRGIKDGVDVRGYYQWSLLDNFEWALGYRERFGLIHVDFNTLQRTPKDSAYWYRDVIRSNGGHIG